MQKAAVTRKADAARGNVEASKPDAIRALPAEQDEAEPVHPGIGSEAGQQKVIDLCVAERVPRHLGETGRQDFERNPKERRRE